MTIHKEALTALVHEMEYVLSCINEDKVPFDGDDFHEALRLGKEVLAQLKQEPVAWMDIDEKGFGYGLRYWSEPDNRHEVPLYTTPPQRKPLTDDEAFKLIEQDYQMEEYAQAALQLIRRTEASHGIKE